MKSIVLGIMGFFTFAVSAQSLFEETKPASDAKILIVYFSRAGYNYNGSMPNYVEWTDIGHTARVAGFIKDYTDGDTFEILPVEPYPDDYNEMLSVSTYERDNDLRPEFIGEIENIDDYDIFFIGGPVWYGGMPMILHTFYDEYKDRINGKTIIPFDTHGGSGIADYVTMARRYCPDSEVLEALAVTGTNSSNSSGIVKDWLLRIGILSENDNAAVSSIERDNESVTSYYTVTGMPVSNPDKGLFIEVKGGKSTKIIK